MTRFTTSGSLLSQAALDRFHLCALDSSRLGRHIPHAFGMRLLHVAHLQLTRFGRVSRVAKGGDCKSPALRLRRFESYLSHHRFSGGGTDRIVSVLGIELRV
jgi:hypothetical protein